MPHGIAIMTNCFFSLSINILTAFDLFSLYEFSHILTDNVSQSSSFKELTLPLLDDLIQRKSSMFLFLMKI
jgi:hypothetical protein